MPDGTLFLGSGDAADFNTVNENALRSQNPQSYAGKVLRVDGNGNGLPGHAFCPSDADLTHVCTKVYRAGSATRFASSPTRRAASTWATPRRQQRDRGGTHLRRGRVPVRLDGRIFFGARRPR